MLPYTIAKFRGVVSVELNLELMGGREDIRKLFRSLIFVVVVLSVEEDSRLKQFLNELSSLVDLEGLESSNRSEFFTSLGGTVNAQHTPKSAHSHE